MAQQKLVTEKFGASDQRVVDFFTPINGEVAPTTINATFLGQVYINTVLGTVHIAIAVGSATKANDWKLVSNV